MMSVSSKVLDCNGRPLALDRTRICGIVNVTPDSFSDGGRHADTDAAVAHGLQMVAQGADMLDIGGESTRPGAAPVTSAQEMDRVLPVIEALAARTSVPISIDSSTPEVMRAAVAAGAGLINDVRALRREGALDAAVALGVPVCLMHMQGSPENMQDEPGYADVVGEVHRFLADRLLACQLAGMDSGTVLVDPGFGFGKTLQHNMRLLADLDRFADLGAGILVGLSRKSFLGTLTGRDVDHRQTASASAALIAAQRGASIVRVHDIAETRDALAVLAAVPSASRDRARPPAPVWPDDDD